MVGLDQWDKWSRDPDIQKISEDFSFDVAYWVGGTVAVELDNILFEEEVCSQESMILPSKV